MMEKSQKYSNYALQWREKKHWSEKHIKKSHVDQNLKATFITDIYLYNPQYN